MKLSFLRASAVLALALGLSACGGKAEFTLGGPVTGLKYNGLVLKNTKNGDTLAVAPARTPDNTPSALVAATTFALPRSVEYGDEYAVVVDTPPEHQACEVFGGTDTAGRLASIVVSVRCTVNTFSIGGTVSGLRAAADATPTGLVISNGGRELAIEKDGAYVFPDPVAFGDTYTVAVVRQPTEVAGATTVTTCAVENGGPLFVTSTTVNEVVVNPVNNINVVCTTKAKT